MQDYGIELYFITDQIYLPLSEQPRLDNQTRIIPPADLRVTFWLETELKCRTLHLLSPACHQFVAERHSDLSSQFHPLDCRVAPSSHPVQPPFSPLEEKHNSTHNNFLPHFPIPGRGWGRGWARQTKMPQCNVLLLGWARPINTCLLGANITL